MANEETILAILREAKGEITTQQDIAKKISCSVGKVNYVLKALVEKGFIKAEKFISSNHKKQYKYLLTEQGIKEKISLTEKFVEKKKKEYDELQKELDSYKRVVLS
ncbi:MAG: MarR family EPS-associated transcriptional regulator [Campylobacterales bacterium]|nr:MarR family EPS-associated transcriptional regulator [Campylobacterales bacterium]